MGSKNFVADSEDESTIGSPIRFALLAITGTHRRLLTFRRLPLTRIRRFDGGSASLITGHTTLFPPTSLPTTLFPLSVPPATAPAPLRILTTVCSSAGACTTGPSKNAAVGPTRASPHRYCLKCQRFGVQPIPKNIFKPCETPQRRPLAQTSRSPTQEANHAPRPVVNCPLFHRCHSYARIYTYTALKWLRRDL